MNTETLNTGKLIQWIVSLKSDPAKCEELNEDQIWGDARTQVWQAKSFRGSPVFSPVYQWRDFYSYSPLMLLLMKGSLDLDLKVSRLAAANTLNYLSSNGTLDREIKRVGGPMAAGGRSIRDPETYAAAIVKALRSDIARVEAAHPGYTNVIMCGGKDSLNLLLLPWKNPIIVASALPNYPLVKQFIRDQHLPYSTIELTDSDTSMLAQEILVNFCRNNLEHCRWGPALVQIANKYDGKIIFWKGQLGTMLMTDKWTRYTNPPDNDWAALKQLCSIAGGRGYYRIKEFLKSSGVTQQRTLRNFWDRGAMWQAVHVSFIRQLTGALTLSAYHGPAMRRVIEQVDFTHAVPRDIRPRVGELLFGKPVKYPVGNPGPEPSQIRRGISDLSSFMEVLRSAGIEIKEGS